MVLRKLEAERIERLLETKDVLVQARSHHEAEDLDATLACVRCTYNEKDEKVLGFDGEKQYRQVQAHENGIVLNAGAIGKLFYVVVRWDLKKPFRAVYWGEAEKFDITAIYRNKIQDKKLDSSWEP
jgi:hypothetical protein